MSVKFEVKMTDKIMYDFLLHHNYSSLSGLLSAAIGCFAFGFGIHDAVAGDAVWAMPMFFVAFVALILPLFSMRTKAKVQVKSSPMFKKPLEYELNEEGVVVRQDEQQVLNKWDDFTKAVSTNRSVILYLSRMRAIIFPKQCMGAQYEEVMQMIHTHIPPKKVKIRHIR